MDSRLFGFVSYMHKILPNPYDVLAQAEKAAKRITTSKYIYIYICSGALSLASRCSGISESSRGGPHADVVVVPSTASKDFDEAISPSSSSHVLPGPISFVRFISLRGPSPSLFASSLHNTYIRIHKIIQYILCIAL